MRHHTNTFFILLLSILFLYSCASYKKFDYVAIESVKSLEGIYYNKERAISGGLKTNNYQSSEKKNFGEGDIFKIEFPDSKTLKLSYLNNNEWQSLKSYQGKYNTKKSTFDIWHSRKIYPFVIMWGYNFDKVRIGKDNEGNLVINNAHDHLGLIIPLGAGGEEYSDIKRVPSVTDLPPFPILENNRWGYSSISGDTIIECKYDTVMLFENDIARVRLNEKWGLINREGVELCPLKYKKIDAIGFSEHTLIYSEDEKVGIILRDGTETIPPYYSKIRFPSSESKLGITSLDGYKGIISSSEVLFPTVFDDVRFYNYLHKVRKDAKLSIVAWVTIDGQIYAIDRNGYLYTQNVNIWGKNSLDLESKKHYEEVVSERLKNVTLIDLLHVLVE